MPPARCRLVLVAGEDVTAAALEAALGGGDVASVVVPAARAGELVPLAQALGAAALVSGPEALDAALLDALGANGADGVHLPGDVASVKRARERWSERTVGAEAADRDRALSVAEAGADYVLLGRLGRDVRPEPHPRGLALARWWSEVVTVPSVVPGGTDVASVLLAAEAGADFVALQSAVFGGNDAASTEPGEAVRRANALLDERAPRLDP